MSVINFYAVALERCKCGKPAANEIRATGNVRYDRCCLGCTNRRIKELQKAHESVNRSLAQDGSAALGRGREGVV